MPPPNKRGFKGSPTGVSPPSKRTDHADGFIENFIAAITDPRVVSGLQNIFMQTVQTELKVRDEKIFNLERANADLTVKLEEIKEVNMKLSEKLDKMESLIDNQEQYSRRNSLRFTVQKEEKLNEDTDEIVMETLHQMGVKGVTAADIDRSHRVGKKGKNGRQILCKFKSYKTRAAVFSAKKSTPNNVYISEDLTAKKSYLLFKARLLKRDGKLKQCWSFDGRIYVKMINELTQVVYNESHLLDIINKTYAEIAAQNNEEV